MPKTKQDYRATGARAYAIGVIRIPAGPVRGWQHAAEREGYAQARADWRAANPGADELGAATERNRAACLRVMGR